MMKLLSRGETKENNSFEAQNPEWDKENAFETEYVTEYEIDISTPKDSLAKTYEDKNEMIVILQVPKSDYKNENIQKLLKWGRTKVNKKDYYRDIAVYVNEAETYERTIVFTHAEVSVNEFSVIREDIVTMTVTINQKRDKFPGVAFGSQIDETYQKAWKKVLNPPRLNIYVPVAADENKEYFGKKEKVRNGQGEVAQNKDFDAESSDGRKTFKDSKNKKTTYKLIDMLSKGYRLHSAPTQGKVAYVYMRKLINIHIDLNSKNKSFQDSGYMNEDGKSCALKPIELFNNLGYTAVERGDSYEISFIPLLGSLIIPKVKSGM